MGGVIGSTEGGLAEGEATSVAVDVVLGKGGGTLEEEVTILVGEAKGSEEEDSDFKGPVVEDDRS